MLLWGSFKGCSRGYFKGFSKGPSGGDSLNFKSGAVFTVARKGAAFSGWGAVFSLGRRMPSLMEGVPFPQRPVDITR